MTTTQTDPDRGGDVASRIREARKGAGLTQCELAALVGVTRHTVGSWEAGRTKPSRDHLAAIALHCETGVRELEGPEARGRAPVTRQERMRVLVEAIADYAAEHGYPPTMDELMDETGFSSKSVVSYWLDACEEAGLLVRVRERARAVTLTEAGHGFAQAAPEGGGQPAPDPASGATGAAAVPEVATDAPRPPRPDDREALLRPRANAGTSGRTARKRGVVVPLEERMRAVVVAIAGFVDEHGYPPSVRDLMDKTGFSTESVVGYSLGACEEAGLVVRARGMARAVTLTEAGRAFAAADAESGG